MNELMNKMRGYETETIKDVVKTANGNLDDKMDFILDAGLDILEERMTESSFIAFCEAL